LASLSKFWRECLIARILVRNFIENFLLASIKLLDLALHFRDFALRFQGLLIQQDEFALAFFARFLNAQQLALAVLQFFARVRKTLRSGRGVYHHLVDFVREGCNILLLLGCTRLDRAELAFELR